jgi:hypothetical protein
MSTNDNSGQSENLRRIVLSESEIAKLEELRVLRSTLAKLKMRHVEHETTLFSLDKRQSVPDYAFNREFCRSELVCEVFQTEKDLAMRLNVDTGLLPRVDYTCFLLFTNMPHVGYDYAASKWVRLTDDRVPVAFGITSDGIAIEIGIMGGSPAFVTNCFELSGFIALKQYAAFLRENPLNWECSQTAGRSVASSIIEDIYVPFYRQPEELGVRFEGANSCVLDATPVLSWASLNALRDLIRLHREKQNTWLYPLELLAGETPDAEGKVRLLQLAKDVSLEECEAVRRSLPSSAYWVCDNTAEYLVVSLAGFARAYSVPFLPPRVVFHGDWERLQVLCKVSKRHAASYIQDILSSSDGKELFECVRDCVLSGCLNPLKKVYVDVPSTRHQIAEWVTGALESGRLLHLRERVTPVRPVSLSRVQQRQLTRMKLCVLEQDLGNEPQSMRELNRVIYPLPYFFEFPIIQWERASDKMAFSYSVSLLHQLNKISCLLGFEEVLREHQRGGLTALLGNELAGAIAGKPSLGHWSKALDALERQCGSFKVWSRWFEVLSNEREARIRLIEIRNRIAHPDFLLEEEALDHAAGEFGKYFERIIPCLRSAYSGMACYISRQRRLSRGEDGKGVIQLDCENMDVAIEPFPRTTLTLPPETAESLVDDSLFCTFQGSLLELRYFFRLRHAKASKREIYLYERDYSGHEAVWSGLTTAQSGKLDAPDGLFS